MTETPHPAVLADDLRALAETVPFDATTIRVLEQAADVLDEIGGLCGRGVWHDGKFLHCDLPHGHTDRVHQVSGGPAWDSDGRFV